MDNVPANIPHTHKELELEYAQTNENFRALAEIRFKLLAFVPTLGGVTVTALSYVGFSAGQSLPQIGLEVAAMVALVSMFGFTASLGIVIYDQRNSELYNALIDRATYLEKFFQSPNSSGALTKDLWGGQFQERPERHRKLFNLVTVGHDLGLAWIYGSVLGAWFFPATLSIGRILNVRQDVTAIGAMILTLIASGIFIRELMSQDR